MATIQNAGGHKEEGEGNEWALVAGGTPSGVGTWKPVWPFLTRLRILSP